MKSLPPSVLAVLAEEPDLLGSRPTDVERLRGLLAAWEMGVAPKR